MSLKKFGVLPGNVSRLAGVGRCWRLVAMVGLLAGLAACGSPRPPGTYLLDDIDAQRDLPDSAWEALRPELPPVPNSMADTLPVETMTASHFRFGVDPRSVKVAPGLIVRYTLVTESDRGAKNVTYESLRCGRSQWRLVATVGPQNTWERSTGDEWRPIIKDSIQWMLASGILCQGGAPAHPRADVLVKRLKSWKLYADPLTTDRNP